MEDLISGNNVVLALLATYLIQALKDSPRKLLQWLSAEHPGVVRGFSAAIAALTALGLTFSFSAGTLSIGGLTAENLYRFVAVAVSQYLFQHFGFKLGISIPQKLGKLTS